jgi:putative ABC transport system permease protein
LSIIDLAIRNLAGSTFRSTVVFACALLVSGFALSTTLIVRGAEESLRLTRQRLGADIVVVPRGTESKVEGALLTGKPTTVWMPADTSRKIAAVGGVEQVSAQLFLASLSNASCCSASEMFMVAFDPKTDFTIQPWLRTRLGRELSLGEAIGGDKVFVPAGDDFIKLYGYFVTLRGNLEPTGTGIDQTLFFTHETASDMARISRSRAEKPLEIPTDSISAVMVRVAPGVDTSALVVDIGQAVPDVTPVATPDLFKSVRKQMEGLLNAVAAVLVITLVMSMLFVGLLFSISVNERRREIGVMRALGATRIRVFVSILAEAGLLAAAGGLGGVALFGISTILFHNFIVATLGIPFLLPTVPGFVGLIVAGLLVTLAIVALAAMAPAVRASHQEPSLAMRE